MGVIPMLKKRKTLHDEGVVKAVAKNMRDNSKVVSTAVDLTPKVLEKAIVEPTKFVGIHLSHYIDYLLVSLATFYALQFFNH